ncbi:MAG: hypothetical protein KU37_08520 [Sulfuricurvum sp. PC08-66]|nr:MAG: hypothetical protein KU37_08520 [Sulfuricurvum sp. PC08-66]
MDKHQLNAKITELKSILENKTVQNVLQYKQFDLGRLSNFLDSFKKHIDEIDDDLLIKIESKINSLIEYSNSSSFTLYAELFINTANFLILIMEEENSKSVKFTGDNKPKISEEEFSNRYEKLIEKLNLESEVCNLILETQSDKVPFKVYKNNYNSIVVETKGGTKSTRTKDKLIGIAYRNKSDEKRSYDRVIIEKLLDNSIFDFFLQVEKNDLMEAVKNKLSNNENELLKLSKKLSEIEKNSQEVSFTREELSRIKQESEIAKNKFEDAKDAAIKYAQLDASVKHWSTKQSEHNKKFYRFGGFSILLIFILLAALFFTLQYHDEEIVGSNKNDFNSTIVKEIEVNSTTLQEKAIVFDYSKIAWYILMIFASSSAFWIIRIMVKIALSNLHLSEDARERVVMIQTYLSFVKEGKIDENDKNLILSSLFRPSNIGIIKDESSVTVADMITALKK